MKRVALRAGQVLCYAGVESPIRGHRLIYLVERTTYGYGRFDPRHGRDGRWQLLDLLSGAVTHLPEEHLRAEYRRVL